MALLTMLRHLLLLLNGSWIAKTAMRGLILVENLNVLVQVCFFIIQLVHFAFEVVIDLHADFVLDFSLYAFPMLAFKLALILAVALQRRGMVGALFRRFLNRVHLR